MKKGEGSLSACKNFNPGEHRKDKVRYIHLRLPGGGAVTAAVADSALDFGTGPLVAVGFAFCSPSDQFSRLRGRHLAASRIAGHEFTVRLCWANQPPLVYVWRALKKLRRHGRLPTWLKGRFWKVEAEVLRMAGGVWGLRDPDLLEKKVQENNGGPAEGPQPEGGKS